MAIIIPAPAQTITTFDVPGAPATFPLMIIPNGTVTGYYFDASWLTHGFLRTPDGTITPFDAPGALNGTTTPSSMNQAGTIVGFYRDAGRFPHGFLRDST
ncbi:MAG TPA: hypothetical protein VF905_00785, partial [Nitrospirota bacterium]